VCLSVSYFVLFSFLLHVSENESERCTWLKSGTRSSDFTSVTGAQVRESEIVEYVEVVAIHSFIRFETFLQSSIHLLNQFLHYLVPRPWHYVPTRAKNASGTPVGLEKSHKLAGIYQSSSMTASYVTIALVVVDGCVAAVEVVEVVSSQLVCSRYSARVWLVGDISYAQSWS